VPITSNEFSGPTNCMSWFSSRISCQSLRFFSSHPSGTVLAKATKLLGVNYIAWKRCESNKKFIFIFSLSKTNSLRWENSIFSYDNDDDETSYLTLSKAGRREEEKRKTFWRGVNWLIVCSFAWKRREKLPLDVNCSSIKYTYQNAFSLSRDKLFLEHSVWKGFSL
jgi:hypothetical protein